MSTVITLARTSPIYVYCHHAVILLEPSHCSLYSAVAPKLEYPTSVTSFKFGVELTGAMATAVLQTNYYPCYGFHGASSNTGLVLINNKQLFPHFVYHYLKVFIAGTTPLWIFAMGRFLTPPYTVFPLADFEMWIVVTAGSYSLGVFLKRISSTTAEAFLNWLAKPVCLLFTLLYVTLGIYINMYIFSVLSSTVMVVVTLLPVLGYLIGGFISYLSRQQTDSIKTTATETAIFNCMLVLIMIRFSLPQPDADIASTIPMWVLFMSPVPFILAWFTQKIRRCINKQCAKRREKKYRHFSIVSSLLNVTSVTGLSTSITPKVAPPSDQCPMFIDEKVTVLWGTDSTCLTCTNCGLGGSQQHDVTKPCGDLKHYMLFLPAILVQHTRWKYCGGILHAVSTPACTTVLFDVTLGLRGLQSLYGSSRQHKILSINSMVHYTDVTYSRKCQWNENLKPCTSAP